MDAHVVAAEIDAALRSRGTPARATHDKAYLKSELDHYGASMPAVRAVAEDTCRRHANMTRAELLALVDALWAVPVHDRRAAVVELLDLRSSLLAPADMAMLEGLLREARTWAIVDSLAASVVGALVAREPATAAVLDRWATDDDVWIRRSALLALLIPLRQGGGDFERFGRYADALLADPSFWIRKAIGWVLRDTSRRRPEMVYEWLLPRASRAAGLTVREAAKRLPAVQRDTLLAARGNGR